MLSTHVGELIDEEHISAFDGAENVVLPHPSLAELRDLSAALPLRVAAVHDAGRIVALAVCCVEAVRVHGIHLRAYRMFSATMHDYTRLYARDGSVLHGLLDTIRRDARACCADAVCLNNVLVPNGADALPVGKTTTNKTTLFIARNDPKGWNGISTKKSVRHAWNKVEKLHGFRVEHMERALTREAVELLAAMHRERWQFEGAYSAFERPGRIDEYLTHPANKVLTRVWIGEEIICCYYGMLYGDTLLWHTALINIKYLDYSPLQILLAATAQYAQRTNLTTLDFGLGEEGYKARFGNAVRTSYLLLLPLTAKGFLAHTIRTMGLHRATKQALSRLRPVASRAKASLMAKHAAVVWFELDCMDNAAPLSPPLQLALIDSYEDFIDFGRAHGIETRRYQYQRFKTGSIFAALHDGTSALSHAWLAQEDTFFVGEIQRAIPTRGMRIIYDPFTPPQHRHKGYYKTLLQVLIRTFSGGRLSTFAVATNKSSLSVILSVGFIETAVYRG
jgi:CelD/BcsL family acetyltransferase involved in cellulose biosynthesis